MSLERIKDISIRDELYPGELRNNVGRCPFPGHGGQTGGSPPFRYYPGDNGFKCFGCGAHGSAIDFVMHKEGLDFSQAVRHLADRFNIPLEPWTPEQEAKFAAERKKEDALGFAVEYFAKQLTEDSPEYRYLLERGFTPTTIRDLRLGLANKTLLSTVRRHPQLLDDAGLTFEDLEKASILARNDETKKLYDYFRDRITIPFIKGGRVHGISGRALPNPNGECPEPKYLNLSGVPLTVLFLEENIRKEALVCEGLPDTITAHQWGFPACGQQGTSGMERHAHKFKRCRRVYLCFDTDTAGQKAIERVGRAIHLAMQQGEVRVVTLPEQFKDINEYSLAGHGADDFRELLIRSVGLIDWLVGRISPDKPPVDRVHEVREILKLLVPLDPPLKTPYLDLIKTKLSMRMQDLRQMLQRLEGESAAAATSAAGKSDTPTAVLAFTARAERIPAQDFTFGSAPSGNLCTFLPVRRQQLEEDGRMREAQNWEPVLITVTHEEHGMTITAEPCNDLTLSDAEQRRIPFESNVRGRWRIEGKYSHSIERFIKNEAPPIDPWELFSRIRDAFRTYIWLVNPADYDLLGTWVMQSYVFHLFDAIGYLHLTGTRESGKSNIARLLEELCFNASRSSNQTSAVVFRSIEANCGTRIFEEAERLNAPKPGTPEYELMLMANDGYKRGAKAERMEEKGVAGGKKKLESTSYSIYSPKVLVSINDLNYVLASRCIALNCVRARPEDLDGANIKDLSQSMHWERKRLADLRDQLHCWALQSFPDLWEAYKALLDDPTLLHLRGREREMWLPLMAIAIYLDNQRAIGAAGGNLEKAEELLAGWDEAGDTVQHRLLELQKGKEAERRVVESDQSLDIAVLKSVYQNLIEEEICPFSTDLAKGDLYVINDLAKLVSEDLLDLGLLAGERGLSGRRMVGILTKTAAMDKEGRADPKGYDPETGRRKTKRCIALRADRIKAAINRLGGKVAEDAASA